MKYKVFFLAALVLGLVVLFDACSLEDFSRHYRQLDSVDIRPFSYQFKNPEMAPGDTVELSVIFSGKKVKLEDISWRVNWNYLTNRFGSSAPVKDFEKSLDIIDKQVFDTHGGHSQTATIKFVVPDSMLYKSYATPESLEKMAAMYNFPNMPKIDSISTSKKGILKMFENLAKCPPFLQQAVIDSLGINGTVIDGLAQIFSAMFEIYIEIPNTPRSKIRHTVRYHGKLRGIYGVFTNKNPEVDVYYGDSRHPVYISDAEYYGRNQGDTIRISLNRNKTNTLDFFPNDSRDSAISLERAFSLTQYDSVRPKLKPEKSYTRWFLEGGETYSKIWFSTSSEATQSFYNEEDFTYSDDGDFSRTINIDYDKAKVGDTGYLFLVLFDELDDIIYRPQGRTTIGFPIKFVE